MEKTFTYERPGLKAVVRFKGEWTREHGEALQVFAARVGSLQVVKEHAAARARAAEEEAQKKSA